MQEKIITMLLGFVKILRMYYLINQLIIIRNKDHINININKLQASKIKQGSSNIVDILNIIFEELIINTIIEH